MELLCCIRGGEGVNHVSSAGSQSVLAVHSRVLVLDTRRAPARHATAQVAGGRLDGSPSGFPEKILLLTVIGLMWKGRFGVPPFANRHRPLSVNDVLPRLLQLVGRHIRHRVVIVAENRGEELGVRDVGGNDGARLSLDQYAAQQHPVTLRHVLLEILKPAMAVRQSAPSAPGIHIAPYDALLVAVQFDVAHLAIRRSERN